MTISSLADDYIEVGKNYGYRTGGVTKVTIHHMAGIMSAADCARYHRDSDRQASANYYIGFDGDIVCGVIEEMGAWTSSSWDNDNAAITIECSNNIAYDPWTISGKTWNSLINLVADICNRYGINPYYDGTPSASFTEHRMFAGTACPGEYIHDRLENGQIISEVKDAMQYSGGEWEHDGNGWWYRYPNGSYPVDEWAYIDSKWYYFDKQGYMVTGWIWYDVNWYYCKPDSGEMVTGWNKIRWKKREWWFWFDNAGAMARNMFARINDKWYCFDNNGCMIEALDQLTISKDGDITISNAV